MFDSSETRSPPKLGWEFRKEMVVNLRGKLQRAFKNAGWEELFDENEASGAYSLFCEDDQIKDLANKTLRSFMLEQCSREEDKALKSVLEAETQAFLNAALERNQKHREQCIRFMNKALETFSSKYQRKLNTFIKITSSNIGDESNLQSFHEETTLKLCDEYDDAEKRGKAEFQNGYREQILERFEGMFSIALTDRRKLAEEKRSQIQDTIAKHCENYSKLLNEEAIKIQSTTELGQMHQTLSEATVQKFKIELSFLGTTQYNLAELKLTESLYHANHKILGEISAIIKKNKRTCKEEVEAGIVKYKSEMMMVIKTKPVSTDQSDLSEEHQRVFKSVLSDFDSRLPKVDSYFTEDLKSTFKQRLEAKLLNKLAVFEKEWQTNCRTVKLEVQEHLASSSCILQQALRNNTFAASKLEDIESFYRNKVVAEIDRFHQRFPNLSKNYRQQQFVSRLYENTESFIIDMMETKYMTQMIQFVSQKPYTHGEQLQVLHKSILNSLLSQSNDTALHQQLMVKIEIAHKNIQKEQEVKVSPKLSEAAALSEKLLVSHSSEIFKRFCDGEMVEEIEVFRQDNSQQILQQYTQTLSWAESTNAHTNLLRELEIGLNTSFDKARLAIEQLETFYNECYRQKDLSSENVMIPPEVCQNFHDNACSSAISKCIKENLLPDEKVFTKESKTFLNKMHKEKLADAFVIGIDFGWEYCKSAVYANGKIQMIPHYDESGEEFSSMQSYVGVGDCDGLVGQHAKSSVEKFSEFRHIIWGLKLHYFQNIKIYTLWIINWCAWKIGENPSTISLDGTNYLIATVVSKLFKKLKTNAEKFLNHSVNKCVLTIDHRFDNPCRCDIVKAVELAGFKEVEVLEKCDSAVLLFKHIVNLKILKRKIAFLDFGNVFKFYILKVSETGCTMLTNVYHYSGGGWLLCELVEYCIKLFCTLENVNRNELDSDATFNYQKRRIYIACEKAIKALSLTETVKVSISCFYKDKELCAEITRAKMEEILNPIVTHYLEKFLSNLSSSKLSLENIDEIIISGGFSRMPLIQKTLTSLFDGRPLNNLNVDPDEVEARGAAIKGAQLAANLIRTGKFKTN
ncbi:unnamed protein product [Orchesella dallaii]|uniref:Heat shock 70 kDa protein n=1 Tax=Orchesella dallaii TaxID=48710 RepID=A0ABP1PS49_9HEXA